MAAMVVYLQNLVARLRERQEGQTMAEYALILGGIAVVVIAGILILARRSATCSSRPAARSRTSRAHSSTSSDGRGAVDRADSQGDDRRPRRLLQNLVTGLRERCERQTMTEEQAGTCGVAVVVIAGHPIFGPAIDEPLHSSTASNRSGAEAAQPASPRAAAVDRFASARRSSGEVR